MAKIIEFSKAQSRRAVKPVRSVSVSDIDIVKQAIFFLKYAAIGQGIKLTEKGNLGQKFVKEFWNGTVDKSHEPFPPNREADCLSVTRIYFLLLQSQYVTKNKRSAFITDSGNAILDSGPTPDFYRNLFEAAAFSWNWQYGDRYPDYGFIQDGLPGLINSLWSDPHTHFINAIDLFSKTFRVGDNTTGEVDIVKELKLEDHRRETGQGEVTDMVRCLQLRFMIRFCVPFGILRAPKNSTYLIEVSESFEKTEFLRLNLHDIICPVIHKH